MFVSPQTLREFCLDFLRQQLNCSEECEDKNEISISGQLAEELLESISAKNQLTDEILLKPIFDIKCCHLRSVRIINASKLTVKGLRVLKSHRITDLVVNGLEKCTINELIGCLGEHTLHHLWSLNVSRSLFTASNKFCVVVGLAKLQSLRHLDVSHTDFNNHGLDIVVEDLPLLQCLNISATRVKDISPLKKCRQRLRSLSMYNFVSNSGSQELISVLTELNNLVILDISDDTNHSSDMFLRKAHDFTPDLLRLPQCFPCLKSLDISGRELVNRTELDYFLQYKKSNKSCDSLIFLGLLECPIACDQQILTIKQWYDEEIVVSGNASEEQLKESLKRYQKRHTFIQKCLFHLYNYTLSYSEPRIDLIELIVESMRSLIKSLSICMAGTACLYNLTKNQFGDQIHPNQLRKVVDCTLLAMQTHPNHQQLQKNALLTLCSDRILQDVTFDRFLCTQLVLDSLVAFKETAMNRMAVAICSILAAKISTDQTSDLGAKPIYMETLLAIVSQRITNAMENDIMLKFTLSALWNLTDESPKTCQMFLLKGGMDLYLQVLTEFRGESTVETKVLGLLNNIAEVSHLRSHLMSSEFLLILRELMKCPEIDVSYFSAGIFAHLCCDGIQTTDSIDLTLVLNDLINVVLNWKTPEAEMVAYRSFVPFLPLLNCFESPAVQLWAIWAIHHVCSKNPKRYCEMLVEEEGVKTIQLIIDSTNAEQHNQLKQYCVQTLDVVKQEFPNIY